MGEIQCNTGYGRVFEEGNGWRIQGWIGQGNPCRHTCYDLGSATSAADRQAYRDTCAIAHSQGAAAWIAVMPAGFQSWFSGLPAVDQGRLYECARFAGAHSLDP